MDDSARSSDETMEARAIDSEGMKARAMFQHNIAQHCCAQHVGHIWPAPCCIMLQHMLDDVGSSLKMFKFFLQHFWMLHDVVLVWARSCNIVAPKHAH